MGNGAKAAQKRERNAKEAAGKGGASQLGANKAAQIYKCKVCMQTFQVTTKKPELDTHASSRHSKTFEDCFPGVTF